MDYLKKRHGFTLIELMIVLAIVAFLSMVSLPSFFRFLSKAKRTEAYMHLGSIYVAQKAYWAENGSYASALQGPKSLGWKPEGYTGGGAKERFYYTYGFSQGTEGQHYFTGKLGASAASLGNTKADVQSFTVAAAGDIDGDGELDVLTVNDKNSIEVVKDDLL